MESSGQRRLGSIFRHILLPYEEFNRVLHPALTRSGKLRENGDSEAVVIGGMILDIHAIPSSPANAGTTTPGKVSYVLGGVARNIAECMSKLGTLPFMISALGLDMAGNLLLENWISAGLSTEGIRKHNDIKTAVVCNVLDVNGEVAAGVASVEAIEKFLTPEWIDHFKINICSSPILMIDANLNPHALEISCEIAAESNVPVWFEPVSVIKSRRIASIAKHVTIVSPNEDELIAMANSLSGENLFPSIRNNNHSRSNNSPESLFHLLKLPIWVLLEKGIKVVIVTLGSDGVFLCSKGGPNFIRKCSEGTNKAQGAHGQLYGLVNKTCPANRFSVSPETESRSHLFALHFPALTASVVRLTGAGDCLVGATLASLSEGLDIMQSVAVGIAAAKVAVESEMNVPDLFNISKIADDARSVYYGSRVLS